MPEQISERSRNAPEIQRHLMRLIIFSLKYEQLNTAVNTMFSLAYAGHSIDADDKSCDTSAIDDLLFTRKNRVSFHRRLLRRPSAARGAAQPPRPQGASFRRKREPRGAWKKQRSGAVKRTAPLSVEKSGILPLFRVFLVFCLSHSLPGGKTRKVRKPMGFHPFWRTCRQSRN